MARTMILARELAPGDRILQVGLGGVSGSVTAVRVTDRGTIFVTFADGRTEPLGAWGVALVERELPTFAEAR